MMYKNIKRWILASLRPTVTTIVTAYTCPAWKQAEVSVFLYNEHSWAVSATVGLTPSGGSSRPVFVKSMAAWTTETVMAYENKICLGAGDSIQITADTANKANVVVSGVEYTLA